MKIKHGIPASHRWGFLRWTDIPSNVNPGRVYLRRLILVQTPWWGVFLHWIFETDSDRDPHDHPWNFLTVILRGGYSEEVTYPGGIRDAFFWQRWSWHRVPVTVAHKIVSISDRTVTLVVTGRRTRVWGFWTPEGWVPWRDYKKLHGEPRELSPEDLP